MALSARAWPPRHVLLAAFTVAASGFVVAPLAIVVLNSFNSVPYSVFPPEGLSLRWYQNLLAQPDFLRSAVRSVVLATVATAVALVIGTMASYALARYPMRGGDLLKAFLLSPIVLPKIVLGVALFLFFVRIRMIGNPTSLVLTHVLVVLPFVIAMLSAALANFDWTLEEAALDLGAGPLRAFFRIVLPQISTSMVIAGVFAWVTSFDQVETTIFLVRGASENTLPVEMFLYLQKWQDPTIAALSTLLIVFAVLIVGALGFFMRRRNLALDVLHRGH